LLADSGREQIKHQAPTSWRVLPNVLASALRAVAEVSESGEIGLQSLKDNPTFIQSGVCSDKDVVLSSGGYHDHRAAKAIDGVNSALIDMCVLASRQVSHLLDGGLGLPPLLSGAGDGVGTEYLAWGMTEPLATACRAAQATTLNVGLQDPAGNQSDIPSLGFIAYGKHREVARSFDACFATLAITATLASEFRTSSKRSGKTDFAQRIYDFVHSAARPVDVVGEPLRRAQELIRVCADERPTAQFAGALLKAG
jgi:histidine ammonia-lyase